MQQYPVHIKFDTGMHRLGFDIEEANELIDCLKNSNRMVVRSVFSHLAAGEDVNEDAFTLLQAEQLSAVSNELKTALGYSFLQHISNSAATIRKPQLQFDMVRLGIGLYGIDSSHSKKLNLETGNIFKNNGCTIKNIKNW